MDGIIALAFVLAFAGIGGFGIGAEIEIRKLERECKEIRKELVNLRVEIAELRGEKKSLAK